MGKHLKDVSLVKKAMRGNPKAFGELIRNEQEYLYRMAFLYTREEQDALDAVQESILKAYENIKSLREPEYFRTWLTKILINTAKDLCRKRRPAEDLDAAEALPAPEGLSPEERMDLYDALDRLPDKSRDMVKLKYFDGLTSREIAHRMDTTEGAVNTALSRAVKRLRETMKEETVCHRS